MDNKTKKTGKAQDKGKIDCTGLKGEEQKRCLKMVEKQKSIKPAGKKDKKE